eukprot:11270975-Alexandrium_andersonii.AAC.1
MATTAGTSKRDKCEFAKTERPTGRTRSACMRAATTDRSSASRAQAKGMRASGNTSHVLARPTGPPIMQA